MYPVCSNYLLCTFGKRERTYTAAIFSNSIMTYTYIHEQMKQCLHDKAYLPHIIRYDNGSLYPREDVVYRNAVTRNHARRKLRANIALEGSSLGEREIGERERQVEPDGIEFNTWIASASRRGRRTPTLIRPHGTASAFSAGRCLETPPAVRIGSGRGKWAIAVVRESSRSRDRARDSLNQRTSNRGTTWFNRDSFSSHRCASTLVARYTILFLLALRTPFGEIYSPLVCIMPHSAIMRATAIAIISDGCAKFSRKRERPRNNEIYVTVIAIAASCAYRL